MKKILAFSGSNSSQSINQRLVRFAASLVESAEVTVVNFREYEMPIYSMDREQGEGIPDAAQQLKQLFDTHDAFIISTPEHNSSFPAVFKNTIDWLSRIDMKVFAGKPIALMGTSPGPGGARGAIAHVEKVVSGYLSGRVVGTFSLPKFTHNAVVEEGEIINLNGEAHQVELENVLSDLIQDLTSTVTAED